MLWFPMLYTSSLSAALLFWKGIEQAIGLQIFTVLSLQHIQAPKVDILLYVLDVLMVISTGFIAIITLYTHFHLVIVKHGPSQTL